MLFFSVRTASGKEVAYQHVQGDTSPAEMKDEMKESLPAGTDEGGKMEDYYHVYESDVVSCFPGPDRMEDR